MVTHDIFRAREVSDRVVIMRDGRIVQSVDADAITGGQLERLYLEQMGRDVAA